MESLIVVREVPAPVIGSCGEVRDRRFDALEADLDWLEISGVSVLRIDPTKHPEDLAAVPAASRAWQAEGVKALPLFVLGGQVASRGTVLTRSQLAHLVRDSRLPRALEQASEFGAVDAAAAMGAADDLARHVARARELEIAEPELEMAIAAGRAAARGQRTRTDSEVGR